jgi:gliding motility-associated protein GldM
MAGMKETPRQKMIGMMYLVLTALLALQVSDALIQKFTLLNNSLQKANEAALNSNRGSLKSITEKANETPGKYTAQVNQANEVRKIADEMVAYLEDIKGKVAEAGGGFDETGNIRNPKEEEKIVNLMVGSGNSKNGLAYPLKDKLNTYALSLGKYMGRPMAALAVDANDDPVVNKDPNQRNKDFAELNFAQTPVPAALATLSQKQSEVRRYESEVLEKLAAEVGAKEIKFDKIFAVISAKSNTVVAGTPYEAELYLGATSSYITPRMSSSAGAVTMRDGRGIIRFTAQGGSYDANGLAKKSYTATVSYTGPTGPVTVPITQEYFVAKPTYNIESASLPALYLGCANRLSIVSPGLGALWQPSFSGDGGSVIPGESRGKVTIVPSSATFRLNISNQGNLIGTEPFRVRSVPRPDLVLYANGAPADERRGVSAGATRTLEIRAVADESFKTTNPEDANFRPAVVVISLARGSKRVDNIEAGAGPINISRLASNAQAGDRYVIEVKGVQRRNFQGSINELPVNRVFTLSLN